MKLEKNEGSDQLQINLVLNSQAGLLEMLRKGEEHEKIEAKDANSNPWTYDVFCHSLCGSKRS